MTVYEDEVYKENDVTSKVGMFNRIDVCDTAIVIPLFKDGSLLMVENYRHGVGTNLLELPGGFIDEDEVPLGAAKRELKEETGYTCNKVKAVNWFYTWPGRTGQKNFVVVANGLKKHFRKNGDEPELIKVLQVSRNKVTQELKRGRIKSALTIAALFEGYL
jgi:ADP-ribose pyrophosphatase